jgi:hypothetical protein
MAQDAPTRNRWTHNPTKSKWDVCSGAKSSAQEPYIREPNGSLIARNTATTTHYYPFDELGSTRLLSVVVRAHPFQPLTSRPGEGAPSVRKDELLIPTTELQDNAKHTAKINPNIRAPNWLNARFRSDRMIEAEMKEK